MDTRCYLHLALGKASNPSFRFVTNLFSFGVVARRSDRLVVRSKVEHTEASPSARNTEMLCRCALESTGDRQSCSCASNACVTPAVMFDCLRGDWYPYHFTPLPWLSDAAATYVCVCVLLPGPERGEHPAHPLHVFGGNKLMMGTGRTTTSRSCVTYCTAREAQKATKRRYCCTHVIAVSFGALRREE